MKIISLFSGCGGLDLGFKKAGFSVVWSNEKAPSIFETYKKNHKGVTLDIRNISKITSKEIPSSIGIIGGPPCQSWSFAGKGRGMDDERGKMFLEYLRIIKEKKPLFFVIENVAGMVSKKHISETEKLVASLESFGYIVSYSLVDAKDYGVPQSRKRVFFIGYKKKLKKTFAFPKPKKIKKNVRDAIFDLRKSAVPAGKKPKISNHEYFEESYSYIYMSRNRVLDWSAPAYTVQAIARHIALHPNAPKMELVEKDVMRFVKGKEGLYRRLTVRECARLQTFPDNFVFHYSNIQTGYRMVGNAVPVQLAFEIAKVIKKDLLDAGIK